YHGSEYVWARKNPTQPFHCTGLTSSPLKQIPIHLPSYPLTQYQLTQPIHPTQPQPPHLIFFTPTYPPPHHISHLPFYIHQNTIFHSHTAPIPYHNSKTSYSQQHFPPIHTLKR
ncbi:NlpC/P60 family protein, partial [Bacillus thuringiensis]|uniref:NlpC/P60 family protein n=1 Tax=Bacillus thuringiensis TaxID=1428 RepID=UPI0011A7B4A5